MYYYTHLFLFDTNPLWVWIRKGIQCKMCQNKHAELPAVVTAYDKGAAESSLFPSFLFYLLSSILLLGRKEFIIVLLPTFAHSEACNKKNNSTKSI